MRESRGGRQRHEEKVTFYCTRDELLALERARLTLREHGISADRGRIVREALSYVLADLDGSAAAPVNCLVTSPVYSHDRQRILIPEGSKVLGEAQKLANLGQKRVAVAFHRLIMPDGFSISLDQFKGLNQIGETALQDKVNNHYMRIFGLSVALGLISGF